VRDCGLAHLHVDLVERCLCLAHVEAREQVALHDLAALIDQDFVDPAGDLREHGDLVLGFEPGRGLDLAAHLPHRDRRGAHQRRRRFRALVRRGLALAAAGTQERERADDGGGGAARGGTGIHGRGQRGLRTDAETGRLGRIASLRQTTPGRIRRRDQRSTA
jgi:hypothetical protein